MSTQNRPHVAVCICTYRRPEPLTDLLDRLLEIAAEASDCAQIGVVVIDDDPLQSAYAVAKQYLDCFELGLEYRCTASGNISVARNAAINVGATMADWLAMTDDDCLPDVGWVTELLATRASSGADCVSGRCHDVAVPGAPEWLTTQPFLDGFASDADGVPISIGQLKNTLISAKFLARNQIRFDVEFGTAGGEDVMFFIACHSAGVSHVYSANAVVREIVPLSRSTLTYQLRRSLWYGNTGAVTSVSSGQTGRGRMFASGGKQCVMAVLYLAVQALNRRPLHCRYALAQSLRGLGCMAGSLGVRLQHS